MGYSNSFANASNFVKALATSPLQALTDTGRGIMTGISHLEGSDKVMMPAFLGLGLSLTFLGAATLDPVAIGLGLFETAYGAGAYHNIGQRLPHVP